SFGALVDECTEIVPSNQSIERLNRPVGLVVEIVFCISHCFQRDIFTFPEKGMVSPAWCKRGFVKRSFAPLERPKSVISGWNSPMRSDMTEGNGGPSRVQAGFREAQLCAAGTTEICDFGLE